MSIKKGFTVSRIISALQDLVGGGRLSQRKNRPGSIRMMDGFTLVELLVVIAILAILSTLGVSNFQSARIKARDAGRKSDLQAVAKSLESYINDHRSYPMSNINGQIICIASTQTICDWGSALVDENGTTYMTILPEETSNLSYRYSSDGTSYSLYSYLENTNDPSITTFTPTVTCGTSNCNYKISSSNTP